MAFKTCQRNFHVQKACKNVPTFSFSATLLKKCSIKLNMKSCDMSWQSVAVTFHSTPVFIIHSLVFSPQAGFSRNQNPVRRPVWLLHTASWANSQGQVAIAFPRLQTFPPSPLGAFTSNDTRDILFKQSGDEINI